MTASGNITIKAERLVRDGKVRVIKNVEDEFRSVVTGDNGDYIVVFLPGGEGRCDCEARGQCSHLMAALKIWKNL